MSNEIAEHIIEKCKMIASILFKSCDFLCRRDNSVHQCSVLLRTGLQQTYLIAFDMLGTEFHKYGADKC